jgi:serine/threonine-protein kinase
VGPFGEVLVMDWGVAKLHGDGEIRGTIVGTPGYMAPEQERGEVERIDERTDVYALGAILSFLLEGEEPAPQIPRPLQAIRSRAMAAEPEGRYASVRELSADLGRYLDGLPVAAYRESLAEQAARLFRRHRAPILVVLAYLLMRALLILILGR